MSLPKPSDEEALQALERLSPDDQLTLVVAMLRGSWAHLINQPWMRKWITNNAERISALHNLDAEVAKLKSEEPPPAFLKWRAQKERDRQTLIDTAGALMSNPAMVELATKVEDIVTRRF